MKKTFKAFYLSIFSLLVLLFLQISYFCITLPDNFYREANSGGFSVSGSNVVSVKDRFTDDALPASNEKSAKREMTLMLYGIIPIKNVTVNEVNAPTLTPSGEPFGLKILTKGVIVTDLGNVEGLSIRSPAREGGVQIGDIVTEVNGVEVNSGAELAEAVQLVENSTTVTVQRKEQLLTLTLSPEKSTRDGLQKLGMWTRDSCAGIGTITYYDAENGVFGGLGHSVCDIDTGQLLPLGSGTIVPVCINEVVKGVSGSPGELCGSFLASTPRGTIELNTECGVFGFARDEHEKTGIPLAFKQEIQLGEASILTTINGTEPEEYSIIIEKINYNSDSAVKNMVIRITDERLLDSSGGIAQGMSGSPIIQNGKLVGAVTHVFVNEVNRGYAIFAENMYEISSRISDESNSYQAPAA